MGIVKDRFFDLHLHRNPQNDENLGLGLPMKDIYFATHHFVLTIEKFNISSIWKNYLSHKNSPILLAAADKEEDINLDLSRNPYRKGNWILDTQYTLVSENACLYLSSLAVRDERMYAKILNICDKPVDFLMDDATILEEVQLNEQPLQANRSGIITEDQIHFTNHPNLSRSAVTHSNAFKNGSISPFSFSAYEINYTSKLFHGKGVYKSITLNIITKNLDLEVQKRKDVDIFLVICIVFALFSLSVVLCIAIYVCRKRMQKKMLKVI